MEIIYNKIEVLSDRHSNCASERKHFLIIIENDIMCINKSGIKLYTDLTEFAGDDQLHGFTHSVGKTAEAIFKIWKGRCLGRCNSYIGKQRYRQRVFRIIF